jgi:hypothetical protein
VDPFGPGVNVIITIFGGRNGVFLKKYKFCNKRQQFESTSRFFGENIIKIFTFTPCNMFRFFQMTTYDVPARWLGGN